MKPSAIKRLGLTYDALRQFNDRIVCVALTGFGLDGGDDPAFDYVIQAATGVAAMTGDPDGPPTLARAIRRPTTRPAWPRRWGCSRRSSRAAAGRSTCRCAM